MNYPPLSPRRGLAALLVGVGLSLTLTAQAAPRTARLAGHVPRAAVARAHLLGRVASSETVTLALALPLRDPSGLETFLRRLYTPGDPLFKRFLTPDEFAARFGPTPEDYARVSESARQSGLTVTGTYSNRLLLDVAGPASRVEAAFGVHMLRYQGRDRRLFRAPDADPALPSGMAERVSGVVGLDTAQVRRPHSREQQEAELQPARVPRDASGPLGGLAPADFANAYGLAGTSQTGGGQSLALFELDGYTPTDITAYAAAFGLPAPTLQNILVDGATGTPGANADECTLDIELALAGAPGLSQVLVYETPNDGSDAHVLDCYNKIATDNIARQVATSWGSAEDQNVRATLNSENTIFQQMAAQGQSVFAASGDNGAYDDGSTLSVDDPASQPYVTGVGGTSLTLGAGPGSAYVSETAWAVPTDTSFSPRGSGTGGGVSTIWPAPVYQAGLASASAGRSVPDVALDSDPNTGYSIYFGGGWHVYGGTSAAVPLWAGFTARVNQARAGGGQSAIGFFNPPIYAIGASASYGADFHDITTGTNLYTPAVPGYDEATGWGSFVGSALLNTLVSGLPTVQTASVTGTVTASDTGTAIGGTTVSAVSAAGGVFVASALTDGLGNYTLTVPSGQPLSLTVAAYAASGGKYAGAQASLAAAAPGQAVSQSFALRPAHTFGAGLQMLSAPYNYSSLSAVPSLGGDFSALLGMGGSAKLQFLQWEPGPASYIFYPNAPVSTMKPGQGYWSNLPAGSYLHYDGVLVSTAQTFSLPLAAGWNQIGDPFPVPAPVSSLTDGQGMSLASSASLTAPLFRYDTPSGAYAALNTGTDSLQPYVGYWVFARNATALNIPPPAGL